MGYNMKRGAAPKFKELGSSPAKDVDMSKLRSKQAYQTLKPQFQELGKKMGYTDEQGLDLNFCL